MLQIGEKKIWKNGHKVSQSQLRMSATKICFSKGYSFPVNNVHDNTFDQWPRPSLQEIICVQDLETGQIFSDR